MNRRRAPIALGLVAAVATPVAAGPVVPVGPQFQVNAQTTGYDRLPTAAAAPSGEALVVWQGDLPFDDPRGLESTRLRSRIVSSDGVPLGGDVQINAEGSADVGAPFVAGGAERFVVAWAASPGPGESAVRTRPVALDGTPLAAEMQIAEPLAGYQVAPAIDALAGGGFVVVWTDHEDTERHLRERAHGERALIEGFPVRARRLDAEGAPLGAAFEVDDGALGVGLADVAASASGDGRFVVAWSRASECIFYFCYAGVHSRGFAADGTPVGAELEVSPEELVRIDVLIGDAAGVAALPSGDFAVAWPDFLDDEVGGSARVRARRVTSDGQAPGAAVDAVPVDTLPYIGSREISPAATADGDVLVALTEGAAGDADGFDTLVRGFDPDGGPLPGATRVSALARPKAGTSALAPRPDGSYLVVWNSSVSPGDDEDGTSIQARVVRPWIELFRDGFDGGDLVAWDDVVGESPRAAAATGREGGLLHSAGR